MSDEKKFKHHLEMREDNRELLRRNLVDAADHILTAEGPGSLTVRRISDELNASTKVIYSLYGGKDGVANELYLEGCTRLRQCIEKVPAQPTARDYLLQCCWAYWDFALEYPGYYAVMFGNAIPQFQPTAESLKTVATAFQVLSQALSQYQLSGQLSTDDTSEVIYMLWSPLHGVISLCMGQHFTKEQAHKLYSNVIDVIVTSIVK